MLDLNSHTAIIDAAQPFDKSHTKDRPVMLAGSEIVGFARYVATECGAERHVPGRRASDCAKADRIAELEREVARLQAANDMLTALREKDRRQKQVPFDHPEFRRR
jgi:hypothetical protein